MGKTIVTRVFAVIVAGCGPEVDDENDGDGPPGTLEYESPNARYYRDDRRVDIVAPDPMRGRSGCGFLTDRAYEDLLSTLDALDPEVDYGWSECFEETEPTGTFYVEGFRHSPFRCSWYCCHVDLIRAATVYWAAASSLDGPDPNIDGEIYVALEPDIPCPK